VTEEHIWCACEDTIIYIWSRDRNYQGFPVNSLSAHSGSVTNLCNLGSEIWSTGTDKTICVWNAQKCSLIQQLPSSHTNPISYVKQIASAKLHRVWTIDEMSVRMWEERAAFDFGDGYYLHDTADTSTTYVPLLPYKYLSNKSPIRTSKSKNVELENELWEYKKQVEEYKREIENWQLQSSNNNELHDQINAQRSTIGDLQRENENLATFIREFIRNLVPGEESINFNNTGRDFLTFLNSARDHWLRVITRRQDEQNEEHVQQMRHLQNSNSGLQTRLKQADTEIACLQETIAELEGELQTLSHSVQDTSKYTELEKIIEDSDARRIELEKQISQKNHLIHNQLDQIREQEKNNRELLDRVQKLELDLSQANLRWNEDSVRKLEQLRSTLDATRGEKIELETRYDEIKNMLDQNNAYITTLENKLQTLELEKDHLRIESEMNAGQVKLVTEQNNDLNDTREKLLIELEQYSEWERVAIQLKELLDTQETSSEKRHAEGLARLGEKNRLLLEDRRNLEQQLAENVQQVEFLTAQLEQSKSNVNTSTEERMDVEKRLSQQMKLVAAQSKLIIQKDVNIEDLRQKLDSSHDEHEHALSKCEELAKNAENAVRDYQTQIRQLAKEIKDTKNELDRRNEERDTLRTQLTITYTETIASRDRTISDLKQELERSQKPYDELSIRYDELLKQKDQAMRDHNEQRYQMTKKIEGLVREMEELRSECTKLKQDLSRDLELERSANKLYSETIKSNERMLEATKDAAMQLRDQLQVLETKNEKLRDDLKQERLQRSTQYVSIQEAEQETQRLEQQCSQYKKDLTEVRREIQQIKQRNEDMTKDVAAKAQMIRSQQELINEYGRQNGELQTEVDRLLELNRGMDDIKRQQLQLVHTKSFQKREIQTLIDEKVTLETKVQELQELITKHQNEIRTTDDTKETQKRTIKTLTEQKHTLETDARNLRNQIADNDLEIENLKARAKTLERKQSKNSLDESLLVDIKVYKEKLSESKSTLDELRLRLLEEQEKNDHLQQEVDRQSLVIEAQSHSIEGKERRLTLMHGRLTEADTALEKKSAVVRAQLEQLTTSEDVQNQVDELQKQIQQLELQIFDKNRIIQEYDMLNANHQAHELESLNSLQDLDIAQQLNEELERYEQESYTTKRKVLKILHRFTDQESDVASGIEVLLKEVDRQVKQLVRQVERINQSDDEHIVQMKQDNGQLQAKNQRLQDQIESLIASNKQLGERLEQEQKIDSLDAERGKQELLDLYNSLESEQTEEEDPGKDSLLGLVSLLRVRISQWKRKEIDNTHDLLDAIINDKLEIAQNDFVSFEQKITILGNMLAERERQNQELKYELLHLQQCIDGVTRILKQQCDECNIGIGDLRELKTKDMYTDEEWELVNQILLDIESYQSLLVTENTDQYDYVDDSKTVYYSLKLRVSEACLILINMKKANDMLILQLENISMDKSDMKNEEKHPAFQRALAKAYNLIQTLSPAGATDPSFVKTKSLPTIQVVTPTKKGSKNTIFVSSPTVTTSAVPKYDIGELINLIEKLSAIAEQSKSKGGYSGAADRKQIQQKQQIQTLTKARVELDATVKQLRSRIQQLEKVATEKVLPKSPPGNPLHRSIDITFTPVQEKSSPKSSSLLKQYTMELSTKLQHKERESEELQEVVHELQRKLTECENEVKSICQLVEKDLNQAAEEFQEYKSDESLLLILSLSGDVVIGLQGLLNELEKPTIEY
jgi:chromosome segregation ATPase